MAGNIVSHAHSIHETARLQQVAIDGEKLINKLDIDHVGFVTPEELYGASKDFRLTAKERHTALHSQITSVSPSAKAASICLELPSVEWQACVGSFDLP